MNEENERTKNNKEQMPFRKELRNNLTPAEATFWKLIKNKQLDGLKFRRQQSIGSYIVDFYCPEIKLVIELDGESHAFKEEYDGKRSKYLNDEHGIHVLRFENMMVFASFEGIIREVREYRQKFEKERK